MKLRTYDKDFKVNALGLYKNGKSGSDICRDLGIPMSTFWSWLKQEETEGIKGFSGSGNVKPSNEEALRLKRELEDVRQERDILKKALAIFSRQRQ